MNRSFAGKTENSPYRPKHLQNNEPVTEDTTPGSLSYDSSLSAVAIRNHLDGSRSE
jgi:hypothetical protein